MRDIGYIRRNTYKEYFHPKASVFPDDVVIDAGVSGNIDVAVYFAEQVGPDGKVFAFEPEPTCYAEATAKVQNTGMEQIEIVNAGLWSKEDILYITNAGIGSAVKPEETQGSSACRLITLDSFVDSRDLERVDAIKADVEGTELNLLIGAQKTIVKHTPKLIICLYHKPEDIYTIPLFIHGLNLGYRFYATQFLWKQSGFVLFACPPAL